MAKAAKAGSDASESPLSEEAIELLDHIAAILADEFVAAMKETEAEDSDEGSHLRALFQRQST